jgi:hypothetical protein
MALSAKKKRAGAIVGSVSRLRNPPRPEGRRILSPTHSFSKQPLFFTLQRLAPIYACRPVRICSAL